MGEIYRRLSGCVGAVVLGFSASENPGEASIAGTPWLHLEAGMAYSCQLPLLIVREPGIDAGAFDDVIAGHHTYLVDLQGVWNEAEVAEAMRPWFCDISAEVPDV
jgi:hypothetical protein